MEADCNLIMRLEHKAPLVLFFQTPSLKLFFVLFFINGRRWFPSAIFLHFIAKCPGSIANFLNCNLFLKLYTLPAFLIQTVVHKKFILSSGSARLSLLILFHHFRILWILNPEDYWSLFLTGQLKFHPLSAVCTTLENLHKTPLPALPGHTFDGSADRRQHKDRKSTRLNSSHDN